MSSLCRKRRRRANDFFERRTDVVASQRGPTAKLFQDFGIAEMAGGVLGCPTRFRCPIATCGKERCVECKVEWHDDKSCEEFQAGLRGSAEAEVGIAEMKNAGVVKECPRCKAPGVLAEGCYHVTCERCKAEMCWVCGEDITGNYLPHFAHGMPCKLFPNYDHIP
eukprot:Selendium_serpulae@DN5965_c6_g1_i8.p1